MWYLLTELIQPTFIPVERFVALINVFGGSFDQLPAMLQRDVVGWQERCPEYWIYIRPEVDWSLPDDWDCDAPWRASKTLDLLVNGDDAGPDLEYSFRDNTHANWLLDVLMRGEEDIAVADVVLGTWAYKKWGYSLPTNVRRLLSEWGDTYPDRWKKLDERVASYLGPGWFMTGDGQMPVLSDTEQDNSQPTPPPDSNFGDTEQSNNPPTPASDMNPDNSD
ncbi:hypothetical protein SAMD00023353_2001610 [Rosellinia necatrix]|uniref:Uncharacterized protein n=1 Tax=Rosellinia necatrix TaxID=77044 RepID=A0A1S8A7U4_ROSNE|nr:hypothetical protein SAMD00023353_2001610 [Rosellinia necatrix]